MTVPANLTAIMLAIRQLGYQVQRSLRLRAGASAYASRVDGTGDLRTFTLDMCLKRGALGSVQTFFSTASDGNNYFQIRFETGDQLRIIGVIAAGTAVDLTTTAVFRDPTGHYHISMGMDSTQATAGDRVALTVNGSVQTLTGTAVSLNAQLLGTWATRNIGRFALGGNQFDGYISDAKLITGQKLPASNFGQSDSSGNWVSKDYSGTYGTNGWRLKLDDPTNLTTLMLDRSGNGNNWTANNISLTAGESYDSMLDVPLGSGGNERGNYATLNPLVKFDTGFVTDGNLKYTPVGGGFATIPSTIPIPTSGKWYLGEFYTQYTTDPNDGCCYLLVPAGTPGVSGAFPAAGSYGLIASGSGGLVVNGVTSVGGLSVLNGGEIVRIAVDVDAGKVWVGRPPGWYNNTGGYTGDPATGANPTFSFAPGNYLFAIETSVTNADRWHYANFGQRPFTYTPPSGFQVLHTGNLISDTVTVSGSFTGNASTNGPVVWMNGAPETLTINGNAVTWGTHADKTAGGFKLRTSSASYNSSGSNTWTATVRTPASKSAFRKQLARANP